jgi:hypothetical protein
MALLAGAIGFYAFCELLPKMVFRLSPNRLCLLLATPFRIFDTMLKPLVSMLSLLSRLLGGRRFTGRLFRAREELRLVMPEKKLKVSPRATWLVRRAFERGTGAIYYFGHGSPNLWMDERVWFGGDSANSDNQLLAGTGFTPFVTTMTCNTGAIDYPIPRAFPAWAARGGGTSASART